MEYIQRGSNGSSQSSECAPNQSPEKLSPNQQETSGHIVHYAVDNTPCTLVPSDTVPNNAINSVSIDPGQGNKRGSPASSAPKRRCTLTMVACECCVREQACESACRPEIQTAYLAWPCCAPFSVCQSWLMFARPRSTTSHRNEEQHCRGPQLQHNQLSTPLHI